MPRNLLLPILLIWSSTSYAGEQWFQCTCQFSDDSIIKEIEVFVPTADCDDRNKKSDMECAADGASKTMATARRLCVNKSYDKNAVILHCTEFELR